ncbi:MAG: hypothetical protein ABWY52_03205 [Candidatus Limnocylindrales bacterium]
MRIRAERGAVSFVDLICRDCGGYASAIATLVMDAFYTHIELGELDEQARGSVEIDDVLAMEHFLADFDGDFRRLFGEHGVIDGSSPA